MATTTYPSPYPAYTETYLTPEGYIQGQHDSMAYYAGGPDPMQPCAPSAAQRIHHSNAVEVHHFDPMPAYNYVPTTSPPLYEPAAGSLGVNYQDPKMQTFCHAFGSEFSFYNTTANSGMPQGYHIAMQGFPEAVEARAAIKKEIQTPQSMLQQVQQDTQQAKKSKRRSNSDKVCGYDAMPTAQC
ncbi:hypothetical protein, conserved [Eimeria praecox]|uniref:Uncharacterized protein n=1 Tax=Eimeria praecox TaxID=51316 RepID=U6G6X1_9EIME|nr:hypothetical protein, conserved [Eimeria praecox]